MAESKQVLENPQEQDPEIKIQTGSDSGTKISNEENNYLKDIYYNPRSPVAFSGFQKIYKFIKNEGKDIKPQTLKVWLSKQEAYTFF